MRNEAVEFLSKKIDHGAKDIVFLTGDLGFSVLEPLREKLGTRFINVGIAEALMTTLAASFATYGNKTFTYSITPFATLRCLEQIRNDVCYHNCDVTIIGIGAGYGYGALGPTHHAIEDLAAVWSLPNIVVYNPGDLNEAFACFEHSWLQPGPKYLRLSKGGDGYLTRKSLENLKTDKVIEYSEGTELTIISTGNILSEVLKASNELTTNSVQILSCPFLKPFPSDELSRKITAKKVLVVEEVGPYGGFSSQCAKAILESGITNVSKFVSLSAADGFSKVVGDSELQRKTSGILAKNIVEAARSLLS